MENELLKFIIDLGSIGAICFVVFIMVKFYGTALQKFTEALSQIVNQFLETIKEIKKNKNEE